MSTLDLTCKYCLKRVLSHGGMARHLSSCRRNPSNWCQRAGNDPHAHIHARRYRRCAQDLPLLAAYAREIRRASQTRAGTPPTTEQLRSASPVHTLGEVASSKCDSTLVPDTQERASTQFLYQESEEDDLSVCALPSINDQTVTSSTNIKAGGILSATSLQSLFRVICVSSNAVAAGQGWRAGQYQLRCTHVHSTKWTRAITNAMAAIVCTQTNSMHMALSLSSTTLSLPGCRRYNVHREMSSLCFPIHGWKHSARCYRLQAPADGASGCSISRWVYQARDSKRLAWRFLLVLVEMVHLS